MPSIFVFCEQVLSRDVGPIVVFLVLYDGDVQVLFSHIMAFIYQHNPCFNSNKFSIQGNCDPPSWSILSSDF